MIYFVINVRPIGKWQDANINFLLQFPCVKRMISYTAAMKYFTVPVRRIASFKLNCCAHLSTEKEGRRMPRNPPSLLLIRVSIRVLNNQCNIEL